MPACVSSPITVLCTHAGSVAEPDTDLLTVLAAVPDPRGTCGRRHRLVTVLALSVAAVLAGARSYVAIAEWAHDLPASARLRLGMGRCAPSESTIRRILRIVELDALDTALSGWLTTRLPEPASAPPGPARPIAGMIAIDGKTARGARRAEGPAVHLLAAFDHTHGVVLGQTEVDGKTNQITAFGPLLDRIKPRDVVVTADALHTQRGHAHYLHERGAHYLWIAKANQPRQHTQLIGLP